MTGRNQAKWDVRYLRLAQFWANECSKDPKTKVGAVIVGTNPKDIALGYNGFPPGVNDTPERLEDRETRYLFTQHGERNVLDNASFDVRGGTLVTTMFPCAECAKSLISKGIKRLVSTPLPAPVDFPSWRDTIPYALTMLEEAGVEVVFYEID